jgi:hypothetical protein
MLQRTHIEIFRLSFRAKHMSKVLLPTQGRLPLSSYFWCVWVTRWTQHSILTSRCVAKFMWFGTESCLTLSLIPVCSILDGNCSNFFGTDIHLTFIQSQQPSLALDPICSTVPLFSTHLVQLAVFLWLRDSRSHCCWPYLAAKAVPLKSRGSSEFV